MRANFEFLKKLGVEKWCFHDRDIAPEGSTLEVRNLNSYPLVPTLKADSSKSYVYRSKIVEPGAA